MEKEPEKPKKLLSRICVIGSYIKRRGNLLLLGEENRNANATELEYCIRESLENLRLCGVATSLKSNCMGNLPLAKIISVYEFCEMLIENFCESITAMLVDIDCDDGTIKMNIQIGCSEEIPEQSLEGMEFNCGSFTYHIMEEDVVIDLNVPRGGVGA